MAVPAIQSHSHTGNSTSAAAKMLGMFIRSMYSFVHPVSVHSGSGVYRCTPHNVSFVNTILRPKIDQHRRILSQHYGGDWSSNMKIAVALTDGTPARLAAMTVLRNYRPTFLHMWQLKSFGTPDYSATMM